MISNQVGTALGHNLGSMTNNLTPEQARSLQELRGLITSSQKHDLSICLLIYSLASSISLFDLETLLNCRQYNYEKIKRLQRVSYPCRISYRVRLVECGVL
jgi:hypothetical protein